MGTKKVGALVYDKDDERFVVRYGLDDYSYGLHCGECLDVRVNKWDDEDGTFAAVRLWSEKTQSYTVPLEYDAVSEFWWVPCRVEHRAGAGVGGWYLVGVETKDLSGLIVRKEY